MADARALYRELLAACATTTAGRRRPALAVCGASGAVASSPTRSSSRPARPRWAPGDGGGGNQTARRAERGVRQSERGHHPRAGEAARPSARDGGACAIRRPRAFLTRQQDWRDRGRFRPVLQARRRRTDGSPGEARVRCAAQARLSRGRRACGAGPGGGAAGLGSFFSGIFSSARNLLNFTTYATR